MGKIETRSSKTLASLPELGNPEPTVEGEVGVDLENGNPDSAVATEAKTTVNDGVSGEETRVAENGDSFIPAGDLSDNEDGEVEESGDGGHEFCVGDFVWGKIRSHPWWPGQVYDPADASDLAAKMRRKGRVLVAYFGDGTFAWCKPSQLKPFEENFQGMSKQSVMKTFLSAVQQATDKIFRALEAKMACPCVSEKSLAGLAQPVAENAGIKDGVLVPNGEIQKVSNTLSEPSEFLSELKRIAEAGPITDVLAFKVLMSRVSAFYRAKGARESPKYHYPVLVSGLEDLGESSVKVQAQGPSEDWLPVAVDAKTTPTKDPTMQTCSTTKTPKRKQRSIADLIATEETSSEKKADSSSAKKRKLREKIAVEDTGLEKEAQPSITKKRKPREKIATEEIGSEKEAQPSDTKNRKPREKIATEENGSEKEAQPSGTKKRKPREKIAVGDTGSEKEAQPSGTKKRKSREKIVTGETISEVKAQPVESEKKKQREKIAGKDDNTLTSSTRKARNSKTSSDSVVNGITGDLNTGEPKQGTRGSVASKGRKSKKQVGNTKTETENDSVSGDSKTRSVQSVEVDERAVEVELEKSPFRERKKSKYLSPPFTNVVTGKRKEAKETELVTALSLISLEERATVPSNPIPETVPNEVTTEAYSPIESSPNPKSPIEKQYSVVDHRKANVPTDELLTEVRTRAASPLTRRGKKSEDMVVDFMSVFRDSVVGNGSNYEPDSKSQSRQKRKKSEAQVEDKNPTTEKSPESDTGSNPEAKTKSKKVVTGDRVFKRKRKMPESETLETNTGKGEKATEVRETKSREGSRKRKKQESSIPEPKMGKDEKTPKEKDKKPATALFAAFGPASALPSKDSLITMFEKYGELDKKETNMHVNNFTARILFRNAADAESAYKDSVANNPFDRASVKFSLQTASYGKPGRGRPRKSLANGGGEEADIVSVKRKVEAVCSMLEGAEGKVSAAMKLTLKKDMRSVLEMVNAIVASSSEVKE